MFEKGDELLEEELGMGLGLGRRGKGREGGLGAWRGGGGTVEGEGGVVKPQEIEDFVSRLLACV